MKIKISKENHARLVSLGKNYFVAEGEKPMPPEKVLAELVDKQWREAHPPEYQTTGFDRQ